MAGIINDKSNTREIRNYVFKIKSADYLFISLTTNYGYVASKLSLNIYFEHSKSSQQLIRTSVEDTTILKYIFTDAELFTLGSIDKSIVADKVSREMFPMFLEHLNYADRFSCYFSDNKTLLHYNTEGVFEVLYNCINYYLHTGITLKF